MRSKATDKNSRPEPFGVAQPPTEIRSLIEDAREVLVLSHVDPDGDALGTQLAVAAYLRDIGKSVYLVRETGVPPKYAFLPGVAAITHIDSLPDDFRVDTAIVLECPSRERIGRAAALLGDDLTLINIDHHPDNTLDGAVNWVDIDASSVGEMVFEYFLSVNYALSVETAENLYAAILTDTGGFRFSSTRPRTLEVAGELVRCGADPHRINDYIYHRLEPSSLRLLGKVLSTIEFTADGRCCLLTLTRAMLGSSGAQESESEGIVDYTLFARGVQAGALLREIEPDRTKVSLRSRDPLNVGALAASLGGGGHFNAAGCILDLPMPAARNEIAHRLEELTGADA